MGSPNIYNSGELDVTTSGDVMVDKAKVVKTGIVAGNGVMHVIAMVIKSTQNILSLDVIEKIIKKLIFRILIYLIPPTGAS